MTGDKVKALVKSIKVANEASITALETRMETKLIKMKRELKTDQQESVQLVAKKVKLDKPKEFRSKGKRVQFKFNDSINDSFTEVSSNLKKLEAELGPGATSSATGASKAAQDAVGEGERRLGTRQKHIKLADRSELGWLVVNEYEEDKLASDTSDEKRMADAEKAAEKKAAAKKLKKPPQNYRPQYRPPRYQYPGVPRAPAQPPAYVPRPMPLFPQNKQIGPCWSCNEYSHHWNSCPKAAQQYPFNSGMLVADTSSASCLSYVMGEEGEEPSVMHSIEHGTHYWEADNDSVNVKGKLREWIDYWSKTLKAPRPVLETIRHGYILPLMSEPISWVGANHRSALSECNFVDKAVDDLLGKGCVKLVHSTPHVCSPLMVVESSSGKKRLVIDLKYLNLYLWKDKFKYEDIRTALTYCEKNDFMVTFDLKSGYHHVDIHESSDIPGFSVEC